MLASEAAPWVKTGGLGDVAGALPGALAARGHAVHLVLPLYRQIERQRHALRPAGFDVQAVVGGKTHTLGVWTTEKTSTNVWFLEHEAFEREGVYGVGDGAFADNHVRFALWSRGALALGERVCQDPDVLHLHDWQAALAAVDLRAGVERRKAYEQTRVVLTIHNLAYMGTFDIDALEDLDLTRALAATAELEFWGRASLLKGGIRWADAITTVSPRYAQEIRTPAFGVGLDGLLRSRADDLYGILNGIDESVWSPATDSFLPARFDATDLSGKRSCKRELQRSFALDEQDDAPVLGVVSRLAWQKGLDLVAELADTLVERGAQLVLLGSGEPGLERRLQELSRRHPHRVATIIGFDEKLAHLIVAGSDVLLMPSRYEPCGLTQMYAMRYGTVPVVRAVGGLDDTVEELDARYQSGTGFKFGAATGSAFWAAMQRVFETWQRREDWYGLVQRGMSRDFSWDASAAAYERVFEGK